MKTPIIDFLEKYKESDISRLHMPGHKGAVDKPSNIPDWLKSVYAYDITEIAGADDLYHPEGIIKESEEIASGIFGTDTFYVTEGSSQAIKAMIWLAKRHWEISYMRDMGEGVTLPQPYLFVLGKYHKALLHAASLMNVSIVQIDHEGLSVEKIISEIYDGFVEENNPIGVYVTYPDYFGRVFDIGKLKAELSAMNIPLLADGAHSAYLKFLDYDKYDDYRHPIDLCADMVCASAHKTLPALTGAAYLHVGEGLSDVIPDVKYALDIFGSSSPSYLIMASLDAFNGEAENFKTVLGEFCDKTERLKKEIADMGFNVSASDPLRIVVRSDDKFSGKDMAASLRECKCEPECFDEGYVVIMLTPYNSDEDLARIKNAFVTLKNSSEVKSSSSETGYNCMRNFF